MSRFTDWPVSWALINESDALLASHRARHRARALRHGKEKHRDQTQGSFVSALQYSAQDSTHTKQRAWQQAHASLFQATPKEEDGYTHFLSIAERRVKHLPPALARRSEYLGARVPGQAKPPPPPPPEPLERWEATPDGHVGVYHDGKRDQDTGVVEHAAFPKRSARGRNTVPTSTTGPPNWPLGPLPDKPLRTPGPALVCSGRVPVQASVSTPELVRRPDESIDAEGSDYYRRPAHTSDAMNFLGYMAARSNPYRRTPHQIYPKYGASRPENFGKRQWWARGMARRQLHNISVPYKRCLRSTAVPEHPQQDASATAGHHPDQSWGLPDDLEVNSSMNLVTASASASDSGDERRKTMS